MPSELIVPVSTISNVRVHPNADRLEIAEILGWQTVLPKGQFQSGQRVVYFPPDSVMPQELSDKLGVTQYLSKGRVRCAKLRGEPSFGFVIEAPEHFAIGQNVANEYGITKYEPPLRPIEGDADTPHVLFEEYTDIQNLRNYPDMFEDGEEVILTEKIHGTNCRISLVDGVVMAGSHSVRRKRPADEDIARHVYWYPYTLKGVQDLLKSQEGRVMILYGEVFGKVQSLHYGMTGKLGFVAFDLKIDGRYIDYDLFRSMMTTYDIPCVPEVWRGPFSVAKVAEMSKGKTLMSDTHIREGVVVRPVVERKNPKIGRMVLKYLSEDYLLGNHSDFTEK